MNHQRDGCGLSFSRKAIILTGLAKNTNGFWELSQLKPQLQAIAKKHQLISDARDAKKPSSCGEELRFCNIKKDYDFLCVCHLALCYQLLSF